ncbi:MAG TPA: hypothetical protein VD969_03770 [Symbiobacteriaceae bacterium]|nr:hypothetical protein [Symbiobacteriaceae bacterium]
MIPPLPPPMPPWPGNKPPWERSREGQKGPEGQPQAQSQLQQQQTAQQQQFLPRPQVLHGLVPPQMLHPTYPHWITPQPYFRPGPPPQPVTRPPQQQLAEQPNPGSMKTERTEEKVQSQPFRPVLPVSAPGLPLGARHRHYWNLT